MTETVWPEDGAFRALARKVADGVTFALNTGYAIGPPKAGHACPLGAVLVMDHPSWRAPLRPAPVTFLSNAVFRLGEDTQRPSTALVEAFVRGFECGVGALNARADLRAAGELGLWYRRRLLKQGPLRITRDTPRSARKRAAQKIDGSGSSR